MKYTGLTAKHVANQFYKIRFGGVGTFLSFYPKKTKQKLNLFRFCTQSVRTSFKQLIKHFSSKNCWMNPFAFCFKKGKQMPKKNSVNCTWAMVVLRRKKCQCCRPEIPQGQSLRFVEKPCNLPSRFPFCKKLHCYTAIRIGEKMFIFW